ncbi:MAG: diaminopimelate epimerase [Clostridia bacterium]
MKLEFTKMHGIGNDYIYFNCFKYNIENPEELAIKLSHRNFGIGGDGIVLICPSDVADAKMRMFNIDGSEGKMCGNAIRCVGKYLYDNDIVKKDVINIETLSGIKILELNIENSLVSSAKVNMGKAILKPSDIPVSLEGETIVNRDFSIDEKEFAINCNITCVSMGNPHCVIFTNGIDTMNLEKVGPYFEKHKIFPEQVNTEFVEVISPTHLKMRVWERGSGETLACGTGACATAVASVLNGHSNKNTDIKIELLGGELTINYTDDAVFMTGPCTKVFDGIIEI